jgi:hypothetical protein
MGFAIGENIGPYQIIAQLGSGGMAMVYRAHRSVRPVCRVLAYAYDQGVFHRIESR